MKNMIYTLPEGKNIREMANAVRFFLNNSEDMEAQVLTCETGEYIIQARARNGKVGQWFGLDKAIRVRLIPHSDTLVTAEIGNGEWLKKSLTMATSMVVLWPLAVTSGTGMVLQGRLPGRIDNAIRMYLAGLDFGGSVAC